MLRTRQGFGGPAKKIPPWPLRAQLIPAYNPAGRRPFAELDVMSCATGRHRQDDDTKSGRRRVDPLADPGFHWLGYSEPPL